MRSGVPVYIADAILGQAFYLNISDKQLSEAIYMVRFATGETDVRMRKLRLMRSGQGPEDRIIFQVSMCCPSKCMFPDFLSACVTVPTSSKSRAPRRDLHSSRESHRVRQVKSPRPLRAFLPPEKKSLYFSVHQPTDPALGPISYTVP